MTDTTMRLDFEAWVNDYALRAEPNYSGETETDCFAAWKAATERATAQWISVTERMPEPQVRVLAFAERYKEPCIDVWFGSDFEWGYSHWMQLPPPPAIRQGGTK